MERNEEWMNKRKKIRNRKVGQKNELIKEKIQNMK